MKAIFTRKSTRKYTSDKISDEIIEDLLRAAMCAPSAGNQQPWQFIVIDDKNILGEIPKYHQYAQMLKEANAAIVVCGDTSVEKYKGYWVQDCSAATENILLEAEDKGLGAVWLGVYPNNERVVNIQRLLNIPEHIIPLSIVSLGYPAENRSPQDRFDAKKIHRNAWYGQA